MNHDAVATDNGRDDGLGNDRARAAMPGKNPSESPSIGTAGADPPNALDTKLLGQAIIELNIARKNFSIYPAGHAQLDRSIERAHNVLSRLLETSPSITLGIARDCMFVGDSYLDPKNLVFRDFAKSLYTRDVAAIVFLAGISKEEIHRFCAVLTRETLEIRESGGIEEAVQGASLGHIRVQPIDFSGLHLTEEQEILAVGKKGKMDVNSQVWRSFVASLLSGQLDADGQLELLARKKLNPSEIAQLLNSGLLNLKQAIESYETIIARYVRDTSGNQPFENFILLLRDLNPRLRGQFLSVTFDRIAAQDEELLLNCFPDDVVVEMIQQANAAGKEISPTLIALLERISQLQVNQPEKRRSTPGTDADVDSPGRLSREHVRELLSRESYETYVDNDYQSLLKNLITRGDAQAGDEEGGPSSRKSTGPRARGRERRAGSTASTAGNPYQSAVEERELDLRLTQMMLALVDRTTDADDYTVFSRKIVESLPGHLVHGEIELALDILQLFRRHLGEKAPPLSDLAGASLRAFGDPGIISAAVGLIDNCTDEQRPWALRLIAEIGNPCIPELVRNYSATDYPSPKKAVLDILIRFGERTLEEVYRLFDEAPPSMLRNLLTVVQAVGKTDSTVALRRLLSHEDRLVRRDALITLLELKDPLAADHLRQALVSSDPEESFHAIGLAGYYRVADVAGELVHRIKTRFITRSALRMNEEILRSLGKIGDARVVPWLEKIATCGWSFCPRRLGIVKFVLFESLAGYPAQSLAGLINIGRNSRDVRIRRICERLESKRTLS